MLRFPMAFSSDEKADIIVKKYLNQKVIDIMNGIMQLYVDGGYDAIKEDDEEFQERIELYFPRIYPKDMMVSKFLGLYALLKSEEEFVPELVMEYLMNGLIETQIEILTDCGIELTEPVPEREYILEIFKKEYGDITDIEIGKISAVDMLAQFEDWSGYLDVYFWDTDFLLLDTYTEEAIRNSEVNKQFGIVDNKKDNRFIIPKEWTK